MHNINRGHKIQYPFGFFDYENQYNNGWNYVEKICCYRDYPIIFRIRARGFVKELSCVGAHSIEEIENHKEKPKAQIVGKL